MWKIQLESAGKVIKFDFEKAVRTLRQKLGLAHIQPLPEVAENIFDQVTIVVQTLVWLNAC